ncbi:unnamed protein product, partial [Discosporangium mesarthrocarpum]
MLRLKGVGDPTGNGQGFSFVAKPPDGRKGGKEKKEMTPYEKKVQEMSVQKVTGTAGDLR